MVGFDNLVANCLDLVIRDNLSEVTLRKIENRIFEKYGISMTQSFKEFEKLDAVLREFFGTGAEGLERRILDNICTIKKQKNAESRWLSIKDIHLTKIILNAFGDEDKKKVLTVLIEEPKIISEVLKICQLPQTSGYRKINALINDGLLTMEGFITTYDGKKVSKYVSLFKNIKIDIEKNKITVMVQVRSESLKDSMMLPLIQTI